MIKFLYKKIGERRNELDMSQEDVAKVIKEPDQSLNSARTYISKVEQGKTEPGSSKLAKFAMALRVDVNYFFDGIEQKISIDEKDEKPVTQELKNKEKPTLKKILQDLHSIVDSEESSLLKNLNIDLEPNQRAIIVIHDKKGTQDNTFLDRALSLIQGVRKVVEIPTNGEKQSR
jgi:transcriptional regulator with XRE-family HTH domain